MKATPFYNYLFAVCACFCTCNVNAADQRDYFHFDSDFERQSFYAKDIDPLQILMSLGNGASKTRYANAKWSIDQFLMEISGKFAKISDEGKKVKFLTSEVPKQFLKTYAIQTDFHYIFENGEYNCVSGTALYALIFDKLAIPYIIKETPNHVYLVAYPKTLGIMVESTMPKNGYYMPKSKEVQTMVDLLVSYEMITQEELTKNGHLSVFNNYFYTDKVITIKELTGLQYFNDAIVEIRLGNSPQSFSAIDKADYLCNSSESRLLKLSILSTVLAASKFNNYFDAYCLSQYANLEGAKKGNVRLSYADLIQGPLMRSNDKGFADSVFIIMKELITNKESLNEVKIVHYGMYSNYYQLKYNDKKASKYAELAYQINPDDVYTQSLFIRGAVKKIFSEEDWEADDFLVAMDSTFKDKPELKNHNLLRLFYFDLYCLLSNDHYFDNDATNGKLYFDKALETYKKLEDTTIVDLNNYAMLYADAAAYFYRQNEMEKALELIYDGLSRVPNHRRLRARLSIIKKKLNMEDDEFDEEDEYMEDEMESILYDDE